MAQNIITRDLNSPIFHNGCTVQILCYVDKPKLAKVLFCLKSGSPVAICQNHTIDILMYRM